MKTQKHSKSGDMTDLLSEAHDVLNTIETMYAWRSHRVDINTLDVDALRSGRIRALRGEVGKLLRAEIAEVMKHRAE